MATQVTVRRAIKINVGNYENTDTAIEISATVLDNESYNLIAKAMLAQCDEILRDKCDEIELGKRKATSKAGRFGI